MRLLQEYIKIILSEGVKTPVYEKKIQEVKKSHVNVFHKALKAIKSIDSAYALTKLAKKINGLPIESFVLSRMLKDQIVDKAKKMNHPALLDKVGYISDRIDDPKNVDYFFDKIVNGPIESQISLF